MVSLDRNWRIFRAAFAAMLASFVFAVNGFAAALVQDVRGDVRTEAAAAVENGQRILTGATLTTGPDSQAVLAFDDGQKVVLNQNTQFRITDYQFAKENPQADRSIFNLVRGAARVVTGALVQRSRAAFEFRTPTSTIGIRGTDFMLAIVDQPTYLSVLQGEIAAVNTAGTVTFGAGTFGVISAANVLAVAITAAALPAAAAAAFSSMGAVAVSAGVVTSSAAGAAGGAAGAAGAVGVGTVAAVGAAGAAVAVGSSGGGGGGGGGGSPSTPTTNPFAGPFHGISTTSSSGTFAGTTIVGGSCTGTISGTVDSAGVISGTNTITSCTANGNLYSATGAQPINKSGSARIDAAGNLVAPADSVTVSGITYSCSAPTGSMTATSFSVTQNCTATGTLTPCTGTCSVNITATETFSGTRP